MKRVLILRALGLLVVLVAHVPRAAAQCAIELTDLTDRSTSVPSTSPAFRPFTYRAVASGATSSYEVFLSVRTRGSVFPLTYLTIVGTCPAANTCELRAWCIPEGAYDVSAAARCDGNNANVPSKVLPLDIDYEDPVVEITGTSKLPDGRYRIESVWTQPTGLRAQSYSWNVQQRLGDGTYAPPVYSQTPDVTAAPGDRIGVTVSYCTDDQTRFAHDQAIVGAAPPTVSVSVLDGDGQSVEVGRAAPAPLRVRFTASDPSFNLASLSATFELISVPAGASGYGIGATAQTTSPVSYTAPVAADGTASATLVVGDQEGPYVVRVASLLSQTGSQATFTTTAIAAPRFAFVLPPGGPSERMLVRKYRNDDTYPSPYQVPTTENERPRYRFPGAVTVNGVGASRDVWFRVVDPPDPSAYVPAADRVPDDNRDPMPKGVLMSAGCAAPTCRAAAGAPLMVRSEASGVVEIVLEGTDRYAGDNYQIEASFDQQFSCATAGPNGTNICPRSAIVTAWKRIYVEKKNMFRRGAYVVRDANPGEYRVAISNLTPFAAGQAIRLIHAPQLRRVVDASAPIPGVPVDFFATEDNVIDRVEISTTSHPSYLVLRQPLGIRLARDWTRPEGDAVHRYLQDAVGIVTGASYGDSFGADPVYLRQSFEAAFVEYVDAPQVLTALPYDGQIPFDDVPELVAAKWYENSVRGLGDRVENLPNHRQLLGGSRTQDRGNDARLGGTYPGYTRPSWVWLGRIEAAVQQHIQPVYTLDPDRVNGEVTVHELVHQWSVNPITPAGATLGHCLEVDYRGSEFCLLHAPVLDAQRNRELGDGDVYLHYVKRPDGTVDSEYLTIRTATEPMP